MLKSGLIALAVVVASPFAALADNVGSIKVRVTGLKNDKGVVRIALFNSADAYSKSRGPKGNAGLAFQKGFVPIKAGEATYSFDNVPYGDYAIKLFHDEDNSGKFETGMFGIPKVEFGFSNNAKGKMGPAPYDAAKFTVNQPTITQDIAAQHGI